MPTARGEEDYLYLDPEEGTVEVRTHRSTSKRAHLLLQRWTGEEADYLLLGNLPLSAKEPLRLSISDAWTSIQLESPANGRRVACTLVRLGADGAASQHKEDLVITNGGASLSFNSWKSVCDENLNIKPDTCIWTLRDRINLSDADSQASAKRHEYQSRQQPPKGKVSTSSKMASLTDAAAATPNLDRSVSSSLLLPADALYAESFRVGNLIPRKPLKIARCMSNRGNFQQARILVNGQRVTYNDWIIEGPSKLKGRQDINKIVREAFPAKPLFSSSIKTIRSEFIVPASYVTAGDLEIRLEIMDTDFPFEPLYYEFFQEPILGMVEIINETAGLEAMVELDNGSNLPLGMLLDMISHRRIAVKGLKASLRHEELDIRWERSVRRGADLRVERVTGGSPGRPQRIFLNDGSNYSAEEFIAGLQTGSLYIRNAYLVGKGETVSIKVVGESTPKPFSESVEILFERGARKKKKKESPKDFSRHGR